MLGHACAGLIDSSGASQTSFLPQLHLVIYSFHMPLFFVLAGWFVAGRVATAPRKVAYGMLSRIARPYFIWTLIQLMIVHLMGSAVNHPAEDAFWSRLLATLWDPIAPFWFLHTLFCLQLIALLLIPRIGVLGFLAALAALRLLREPHLERLIPITDAGSGLYTFAIWFGLGAVAGQYLDRLGAKVDTGLAPRTGLFNKCVARPDSIVLQQRLSFGTAAAFCGWAVLLAGAIVLTRQVQGVSWPASTPSASELAGVANATLFFPAAIAGVTTVLFAAAATLLPARPALRYLGRNSMAVFLTHVLCLAGCRIVLVYFFPELSALELFVPVTVAGLIGPLVLLEIAKRLRIARVLALV